MFKAFLNFADTNKKSLTLSEVRIVLKLCCSINVVFIIIGFAGLLLIVRQYLHLIIVDEDIHKVSLHFVGWNCAFQEWYDWLDYDIQTFLIYRILNDHMRKMSSLLMSSWQISWVKLYVLAQLTHETENLKNTLNNDLHKEL